jgi:hypothetical protein
MISTPPVETPVLPDVWIDPYRLPDRFKLQITEVDILLGIRGDSHKCAAARAANRYFDGAITTVFHTGISVTTKDRIARYARYESVNPLELGYFVREFDAYGQKRHYSFWSWLTRRFDTLIVKPTTIEFKRVYR